MLFLAALSLYISEYSEMVAARPEPSQGTAAATVLQGEDEP
jgi:hypothetical protein